MDKNQLSIILEKHQKWLNDGPNGERADLRGADLREVNLQKANLQKAYLQEADLRGANLRGTDLYLAYLCRADLSGANLRGTDLYKADLLLTNLMGTNLREADLRGADLKWSDLRDSDFRGANLRGANLWSAKLQGAKSIPEYVQVATMVCPEKVSFVGWKRCGGYIIKLLIPEDAKRSSATTRKCRCSKAKVLDIQTLDGESAGITEYVHHAYGHDTVYKIGEITYPDSFDEDRWNECSHGIHFFITRREAVEY